MAASHPTFAELIAGYPPSVQELAAQLCEMVLHAFPGVSEMPDPSSRTIGYGYGREYRKMVCSIIPSKAGVKLGLAYSASFADPAGLLEGAGKVHRHIRFTSATDLQRAAINPLLKATLTACQERMANGLSAAPQK